VLLLPVPNRVREPFGLVPSGNQRTSWWVLRNENFRFYFYGSVVSDLGTWLQNTAQVLLAYRLAHSVFAVGLVTCAQFSSPLVLGPWAGVMADRFGGRKTLLGTQIASALIATTLACLQWAGHLDEVGLVSGAILSGLAFAFALPARNVTVRRLVGGDEVSARAAFVMDAVSYNLGRAIAPLLSIAVVHWCGYGWAFAGNAVSFVVFTLILWRAGRFGAERRQQSRVMDGFRIAWGDGRIRVLLLMVAAVTVADDPVLVLGPALANHLGVSAMWSGWFIAALGGGSVLGSLRRSKHVPSLRLAATALALLGCCMILFVMAPLVWLSVAAALGAGLFCLVANSATRTLLSKSAGPARLAPVMAVWAIAWAGSKPVASLLDGLLAGWIGVHWTGVVLALPALIPIIVMILAPSLGHRLAGNRASSGKTEPELTAAYAPAAGSEVAVAAG
jgi:predicted MFS family arabinose efflux permease